ncbi:MAG: TIR domain-containing protein, partial [Pseudonocardiaceae bacterium]
IKRICPGCLVRDTDPHEWVLGFADETLGCGCRVDRRVSLALPGRSIAHFRQGVDIEFDVIRVLRCCPGLVPVMPGIIEVIEIERAYISRKIREQIKGSSVTIVLIGNDTAQSEWVEREIQWSLDKEPPNGLLGIRLSLDAVIPDMLADCGAEILNWYEPDDVQEFQAAIERAAGMARLAPMMPTNSATTCRR